jgi:hypothetical protein
MTELPDRGGDVSVLFYGGISYGGVSCSNFSTKSPPRINSSDERTRQSASFPNELTARPI